MNFKAFRIHRDAGVVRAGVQTMSLDELSPGDVLIRTYWSSVNYKDALAATGRGSILRRFPLNGGVDLAGIVERSDAPGLRVGDPVLVTGYGLSQDHDGGYAEWARVPASWVIPLPAALSLRDAMLIGTAGFSAALAITRMQQNGQSPAHGPMLVTGASGGVGSIAVDLFAALGYEVIAVTGSGHGDWLRRLGAAEVLAPDAVGDPSGPLAHARWGGALDNVGGRLLAAVLAGVRNWGNVASIGLAGGAMLETSVMPFILRGVSLLGISSANCPPALRSELWQRLAGDLRPRRLNLIDMGETDLDGLPAVFDALLARRHRGRTLVKIRDE